MITLEKRLELIQLHIFQLLRLHELIEQGKGDEGEGEADSIREQMSDDSYELTSEDLKWLAQLSARLYDFTIKINQNH